MGANPLDSHAKGKNHSDSKKPLRWTALLILQKRRKPAVRTVEKDSKKKICNDDKTVKGKSGDYLLDDSNINTEIL